MLRSGEAVIPRSQGDLTTGRNELGPPVLSDMTRNPEPGHPVLQKGISAGGGRRSQGKHLKPMGVSANHGEQERKAMRNG